MLAPTVFRAVQPPHGETGRPQAGVWQGMAGFFQMAKSPHQVFSEAFVLSPSNFLVITRAPKGSNFQEKG